LLAYILIFTDDTNWGEAAVELRVPRNHSFAVDRLKRILKRLGITNVKISVDMDDIAGFSFDVPSELRSSFSTDSFAIREFYLFMSRASRKNMFTFLRTVARLSYDPKRKSNDTLYCKFKYNYAAEFVCKQINKLNDDHSESAFTMKNFMGFNDPIIVFSPYISPLTFQSEIFSIEPCGMAHVYDLEIDTKNRYIANDFLVHNSTAKSPAYNSWSQCEAGE
jgi:hypothetical protein